MLSLFAKKSPDAARPAPFESAPDGALKVLRLDASMRVEGSVTRALSDRLIAALEAERGPVAVSVRDLAAEPIPYVDETWIGANFTDPAERTAAQRDALAASDALIAELQAADVLVIGLPVYNFGPPAALKAWIDQIARARVTFRYTEAGPQGLLTGKKAYLLVASGGTEADGAVDFATPYLRHALGFIGIDDVEMIAADKLMMDATRQAAAEARIDAAA